VTCKNSNLLNHTSNYVNSCTDIYNIKVSLQANSGLFNTRDKDAAARGLSLLYG